MTKVQYWIGVASREHVHLGVKGGFAQFSHGKLAPARRPSQGDWIIYYSPKLKFGETEPCQKFVAIGQVIDREPFQIEQSPGFKPWRRKIRYEGAAEADIHALIERLSFIKNKTKWGVAFRFGFFEISKRDFTAIAKRMLTHRSATAGAPATAQQPGQSSARADRTGSDGRGKP